jgi:hypothetical protein
VQCHEAHAFLVDLALSLSIDFNLLDQVNSNAGQIMLAFIVYTGVEHDPLSWYERALKKIFNYVILSFLFFLNTSRLVETFVYLKFYRYGIGPAWSASHRFYVRQAYGFLGERLEAVQVEKIDHRERDGRVDVERPGYVDYGSHGVANARVSMLEASGQVLRKLEMNGKRVVALFQV